MEDLGHKWTDEELAALERKIKKVFSKAGKEMQEKVDKYFDQFVERDKHQRDLLKAGKITKEQYKQWRLAQIARGKRFEALRDQIADRMLEANQVAVSYVNDTTPGIYSLNHNYAAYTIEQVSGDVGFTVWDEQTVKRMIADDPNLLPKRRVNAPKDLKWNRTQFTAEVTAGILLGESIGMIANRVQNLSDANRSGALRNARTAVTGAQNAGRQETYNQAEKMGLQLRKRWVATKDNRTRHLHGMLDGQTVALNEPFKIDGAELMYPGDPTGRADLVWNCRCTMRTVEKEGIEAEPRMMRVRDPVTGRNVVVEEMTYQEWKNQKKDLLTIRKNDKIDSPIDSRNTAKGKPSAINLFSVELNLRQEKILRLLPEYDSRVVVKKADVSMKDLSALTAKTGVEFAMFTKDNQRLIVRGDDVSVNIDVEEAEELAKQGYKWSGHTHPGADDLTKMASAGDIEVLKAFGQDRSVIYDSMGRYEVFEG